eukprot:snap_masked-scaffold_38-processed-gene-2.71-mRNA-1 protein AED:1.00 eAED:1.00 QI:0/-1/0/0/-1/1/1/0/256
MKKTILALLLFLEGYKSRPVIYVNRVGCPIMEEGYEIMGGSFLSIDPSLEIHFELNGEEIECGSEIEEFHSLTDILSVNLGNLREGGSRGISNYLLQLPTGGEFLFANGKCRNGIATSGDQGSFPGVSFKDTQTEIIVNEEKVTVIGAQGRGYSNVLLTNECTITIANLTLEDESEPALPPPQETPEENEVDVDEEPFLEPEMMDLLIMVTGIVFVFGLLLLLWGELRMKKNTSEKYEKNSIVVKSDVEVLEQNSI